MEAYHFRGRAGSKVEFLQMQEEAFQLSNQQEQDDAICKLQVLCFSLLSPQHAAHTGAPVGALFWTFYGVGPG